MKAEYIDHMGDDLRVVNAARVSFDKQSDWAIGFPEGYDPELSNNDTRLIAYLARHNHWTPFSHPQITVRETVPIFVARQRFKHMVGFTYNEVSRRYVDDPPEFYVPEVWRKRADNAKQGSSTEQVYSEATLVQTGYDEWMGPSYRQLNDIALEVYRDLLADGVCPEQARMVLPQSMYTSYYVTGSLAAWARAYKQRSDPHSQVEIQELAKQWNTIMSPLFPVSWNALTTY